MTNLPAATVVTSPPQLELLLTALSDQPAFAVDTESNSLYAYQEQVCLIQISIPGANYIVDPLADLDLSPLAPIFADAAVQKVLHAAEYDVVCLKRDFGFCFANLFDTMWAARILGWPRVGLGDVLKDTFGARTQKRYQRYNWGQRPLEPEALTYACLDTHYLLALRRLQTDALMHQERLEEAQEVFDQLATSDPMPPHTFAPDDFWHIRGAHDLTGLDQAVLRELAIWRDREASRRDRPLFKVLHDSTLVALAQARPSEMGGLTKVNGLKHHHARRHGKRILQAIRRGTHAQPPSPPPPHPRHSEAEASRFEALRTWRKQVAAERGVDPDVVIGNTALWALAERNPSTVEELNGIEELGPWKKKTYGEDILSVLKTIT
ncbi:MAG: HRDC domain-containing protein [Chloroflexi bacterium]|nr:HRDC domain-containing protein [Chloroflexota bacterium]